MMTARNIVWLSDLLVASWALAGSKKKMPAKRKDFAPAVKLAADSGLFPKELTPRFDCVDVASQSTDLDQAIEYATHTCLIAFDPEKVEKARVNVTRNNARYIIADLNAAGFPIDRRRAKKLGAVIQAAAA